MYYSYGMEPVRWMAYYNTIREKQRQYKWSALQLGVVLATYIRGEMMQTLSSELKGDKIYNIYQLLATLDQWDLGRLAAHQGSDPLSRQLTNSSHPAGVALPSFPNFLTA